MANDRNKDQAPRTSPSVGSEVTGKRLGSVRLDDTSGVDRATSQELPKGHRDQELPPFARSDGGWRGGPDVSSHTPDVEKELRERRGRGSADLTPPPRMDDGNRRGE